MLIYFGKQLVSYMDDIINNLINIWKPTTLLAFSPIKGRTLNIKFPKFKQKRESAKFRKTRERDFFFFNFFYLFADEKQSCWHGLTLDANSNVTNNEADNISTSGGSKICCQAWLSWQVWRPISSVSICLEWRLFAEWEISHHLQQKAKSSKIKWNYGQKHIHWGSWDACLAGFSLRLLRSDR